MRVGFTGSRHGMTTAQLHTFRVWLFNNFERVDEFHHGCCVGADTMAHLLVFDVFDGWSDNWAESIMHYHPPVNKDNMSDLSTFAGTWHKPKPYLDRNHDIVDSCDILFAAPETDEEQLRSGTWATIRYAKSQGVEVKQLRRMGGYIESPTINNQQQKESVK